MALNCRFYHSLWSSGGRNPHVWVYDVVYAEVRAVMARPGEDLPALDGARMALGQIRPGERYLQVVYVPEPESNGAFVIVAFRLRGKALRACRMRQRRRGQHLRLKKACQSHVPQPTTREELANLFNRLDPADFQQTFPAGWDEQRVQRIIAYYESQDADAHLAEVEAALAAMEPTDASPA